jgi:ubiquinone/menaquinone biosynthesis C-methylase UbiE
MGCLFRVLKPGGTLAVNVMHWPTQDGLLSRLSRWIMEWTIRKGILYSPYAPELIREAAARAGFEITHESPHGNSVYWLLKKPASQAGLINSA